jgi:hypothetical protein
MVRLHGFILGSAPVGATDRRTYMRMEFVDDDPEPEVMP